MMLHSWHFCGKIKACKLSKSTINQNKVPRFLGICLNANVAWPIRSSLIGVTNDVRSENSANQYE